MRTTTSSSSTSPPGSSCIRPPGHESGTLVNALIAHCGASLSGIGGVRRPGIVHRLDKDTTGLMVVAKNDQAHQSLTAQFADHGRTGADAARLHGLRLGRAQPPARHGRRADRPPSVRPRKDGGAQGRPRGDHPLGAAGGVSGARRQTGRLASGLPARDRADASDPGAPRPYRPPPDGRRRLWPALQDQGRPARPPGSGGARPASTGRPCTPICSPWNTPEPGNFCSGRPLCRRICFSCKAPWKRRV